MLKPVPMRGSDHPAPLSVDDSPTAPLPVPGQRPDAASFVPVRSSPAITRQLTPQAGTGSTLTRVLSETTAMGSQRAPVVIQGKWKRVAPVVIPHEQHKKRRLMVSLAGVLLLCLIGSFTLLLVSPLGHDGILGFNPLQPGGSLLNNASNNPNGLVAQATATAIYHRQTDGYDPYAFGVQHITDGSSSLNWPTGQCTYWANYEYHKETGFWVAWNGNADQWVAGARAAGWNVSSQPHVPSIIVMMPGAQGASGYGHVAVVESIVPNSTPVTAHTSNMNWWSTGGGWNRVSYVDFPVGNGIYFIWHT